MSDRDLLTNCSPAETRYLKEHVKNIRSNPKVSALAAQHDNYVPSFTVGAFQSGVVVDGYPCRLTTGTLALLRATGSRLLGFGKDRGPLSAYDIALGVFLLADDARNIAVSCVDDADELAREVKRFAKRLNPRIAAVQIIEYITRTGEALKTYKANTEEPENQSAPSESLWDAPDDDWADDVDLLAHEYGWRDDYIIWEVPIIRIVKLKESISARRSGNPRRPRKDKETIELLEAVIEAGDKIKEVENG